MTINQGDLYWVTLADPSAGASSIPHPHVIVQDDVFNHSRITTVVACALTTNLARVSVPGNVLLEAGEGSLPRQSVVEVSKISSIEKTRLGEYIGSLDAARVQQILAALRFMHTAYLAR